VGDLSGRRALKKAQTREHVRAVAQRLFGERGFDTVTIADIAREADVAVQTVFNHFATKEELFFDGRTPWVDGPASAVCSRAPGVPALSALRIHLVETVRAHVGSYSAREGRCYLATLEASDTLRAQERELVHEAERRLNAALLEAWDPATEAAPADAEATAPLIAAIWLATSRSLIVEQRAQLTAGADPAQVAAITAERADRILGKLEKTVEPAPERRQTGAGSARHLASAGTAIGTRTSSTTRSTCSAVIAPSPAAM
jgi:AcrR family transcriptional regulator